MSSSPKQTLKPPSLISRSSAKPQLSQNSTKVTSTNTLRESSKQSSRSTSPSLLHESSTSTSTSTATSTSPSFFNLTSSNQNEASVSDAAANSISTLSAQASTSQITIDSQGDSIQQIHRNDHEVEDGDLEDNSTLNHQSASNALALLRSVSYASQLSANEPKGKEKENSQHDLEEQTLNLDAPSPRRSRSSSRTRGPFNSQSASSSDSEGEESEEFYPDPDPFPLPRYYVLTSAGKPVYVSRGSEGRMSKKRKNRSSKSKPKSDQDGKSDSNDKKDSENKEEGYSTSDSEEERSTTRVGVMSALISIFQTDESAPGGGGDKIRQIKTTSSSSTDSPINLTFLHRPPLHLICISTSKHTLPYHTIVQHLQTLHSYLISLLTSTQLTNIFSKRSNFDLRRLLGGTDRLLDSICRRMTLEIGGVLGALQPLSLSGSLRDELGTCLRFKSSSINGDGNSKPPPQTLLVLLLEKGKLVTILRPKMTSLHPKDMEILMHTARIATGRSRKRRRSSLKTQGQTTEDEDEDSEVWAPICLPKFEHRGFLHMYVSSLRSKSQDLKAVKGQRKNKDSKTDYKPKLQLVFVTADREAFPALSSWKNEIEKSLHSPPSSTPIASVATSPSLFSLLLRHLPNSTYSVDDLRIAGLRHFVFKSTAHTQITGPRWEGAYGWESKKDDEEDEKGLEAWEFDFEEEEEEDEEKQDEESEDFNKRKEETIKLRRERREKLINRKRLITLYLLANDSIHAPNRCQTPSTTSLFTSIYQNQQQQNELNSSRNPNSSSSFNSSFRPPVPGPLKLQYLKTNHEAVLVWLTQSFELYLTLSPWMSKSAAVKSANECAKWCSEKENELWISRSQVF